MKIRALVSTVAVLALLAPAIAVGAEGTFERTLTVTGPVQLSVVAGSGDISVRAGAAGSVVVRGTVRENRGWMSSGDAVEAVKRVEQQPPVVQEGSVIRVGELSDELNRLVSVSYEITVPEPTRAQALGCIERMLDFVARHPDAIAKPAQGFVRDIGVA